jgi:hypothetical protein
MSKKKIYSAINAAAMRRRGRTSLSVGRRELCDYVTEIASEFRQASSNDMKFLSYLLAMVVEEAVHQSRVIPEHDSSSSDSPSDSPTSDPQFYSTGGPNSAER